MAIVGKSPKTIEVNRSQLRQDQSAILKKATGRRVVRISATTGDEEKYIVDKRYFDDLLKQLGSAVETLEIAADTRLFNSLLSAAGTIDEDLRSGKLRSFEEVTEDE